MARVLGLKLGKFGRAEKTTWTEVLAEKNIERLALSTGGLALGFTAVVVLLCMVEGVAVVLASGLVFAMTVVASLLSLISLVLSFQISRTYQRKVATGISLIAGLPVWYLIAGVSFLLAVIF